MGDVARRVFRWWLQLLLFAVAFAVMMIARAGIGLLIMIGSFIAMTVVCLVRLHQIENEERHG